MVSQIAGVIARTIVPFVKKNTIINQNEELGLIKFGSRCDIFIPLHNSLKVLVRPGDNIKGSYTKLVEFLN
jgi:phosphatidylserine decarboxylase